MPAVRMKDIARDLGVSAVTVSKVLRGHPDIGQATTDRVLARVKELKYRPNLMARSLVTGRSFLVAFVVPDLVHGFFSEIAITVSTELRKHGYSILIAWTADDSEVQSSEMQHLLSVGIDAMIVATSGNDTSAFELLEERGTPYVLLDRDLHALKAPFVGGDDVLAGQLATQHLIDQGCKRIAHICGPSMSPGLRRLEGYRVAMKEAGRTVNEDYIVTPVDDGARSFQHGFEATQRLLALKPRVDGIFCFNDPLAIGSMEAIFAAGLRVPEDIAIIGCGNHPMGETLRLPLSTVDQDMKGLGEKCAKAVLALLAAPVKASTKKYILKPLLVVRKTSQRGTK
ncbi:transcriptional regulator, LacI family [Granulicella pectinivorans]|uniref:Transcriptional regulator, LacI family n=1 Tax=Granulicella pectinivorans TaxID=474950 RepID=A0A1I6MPM8_9BACT|nr:LacI family DNA-binding transcriptional regulator [Granulicella pectinivorans]SFS17567.1 transcriptional regulator, LacI family [Granulicella pectinivorans]